MADHNQACLPWHKIDGSVSRSSCTGATATNPELRCTVLRSSHAHQEKKQEVVDVSTQGQPIPQQLGISGITKNKVVHDLHDADSITRPSKTRSMTVELDTDIVSSVDRWKPVQQVPTLPTTSPTTTTVAMSLGAARSPVRLFIASLGNPSPYQSTRHSAGHILLKYLQARLLLPPLIKSKPYAGGHVSFGSEVGNPTWTLFQCPTLMNTSGTAVMKAYKQFQTVVRANESSTGEIPIDALVVLHDEMETPPSQFKLRRGNASARGHNGIKSVQASLQSAGLLDDMSKKGKERLVKIGVGIGRPGGKTRDKNDVSAYVLGQLSPGEKEGIEAMTGSVIEALVQEIERLSSR